MADPGAARSLEERFNAVKSLYKESYWLNPKVRRNLAALAQEAILLKAYKLAAELYIFIGYKALLLKLIFAIIAEKEFELAASLTVRELQLEALEKVAKRFEQEQDGWFWAAALWHSTKNNHKIFTFGIRAFSSAINYSDNRYFFSAQEAFIESIFALLALRDAADLEVDENPDQILRRVIGAIEECLPQELANSVASYIEENIYSNKYFEDFDKG